MTPEQAAHHWIVQREKIRKKKVGEYSGDVDVDIARYRWCNVKRADDRVSQWLIKNWYEPNKGHPNLYFACAMARQINWTPTLEEIGFPYKIDINAIEAAMRRVKARGEKVFTGAYMLTGCLPGDKINQTTQHLMRGLAEKMPFVYRNSWKDTWNELKGRLGFGSFMAGQVVADAVLAGVVDDAQDLHTFAPAGPGSTRWINVWMNRSIDGPATKRFAEEVINFRETMCYHYREISDIDQERQLTLMDWQNVSCECYKYWKLVTNTGRPRSVYRSHG